MRRRPRHNTTRMAELFLPHEITGSAKRNPSCFLRPEIDLLWPRSGCRLLLEGSKQEGHRYRAMPRAYLSSLEQSYCVLGFFVGGERSTGFWDKKFVKMGKKWCTKAAARDKSCIPSRKWSILSSRASSQQEKGSREELGRREGDLVPSLHQTVLQWSIIT